MSRVRLTSSILVCVAALVTSAPAFAIAPPVELRAKPTLFEAIDIARGAHATPIEQSVEQILDDALSYGDFTPSTPLDWITFGALKFSGVLAPGAASAKDVPDDGDTGAAVR